MDVVLVRHAAAAPRSAELDDMDRELTTKGRQEFRKSILRLKRYLDPDKHMAIWTSPTARAMQTAQIIAEELRISDITRFDWILTGDLVAFSGELNKADEKAVLFVVGHQPHLSLWAEQLSGVSTRFKKGAMVSFAFTGKSSLKIKPRGLIRAPLLKGESIPRRQIKTNDIKHALISSLSDVSKRRDIFLRKPNDAESVHQLRVSLRQARSLLLFVKPMADGEEYASAYSTLKASAGKLSYMREIDVLMAQRRAFLKNRKSVSGCRALAKMLKDRREKEKSAVITYLSADSFSADLGGIMSWVQRWDETGQDAFGFELIALRRLEKWHQDIADTMKEVDGSDREKLHSLRIKLKNAHNIRNSVCLPDEGLWMDLTRLKQLQRDLGEICDIDTSLSILRQLDPAHETQRLAAEAGVLTEHLLNLGGELKHRFFLTKDQPGEIHA